MKKLVVILLCFIFISGVSVSVYLKTQKSSVVIEDVLPQGVLAYTKVSHLENSFKKITQNAIWKSILELNYEYLAEEGLITFGQKDMIVNLKEYFEGSSESKMVQKIFGDEIALAFYPVNFDVSQLLQIKENLTAENIQELFSDIIMVTRIQPEVQFVEQMIKFMDVSQQEVSIKKHEYKGQMIHLITISEAELTVGFTRIKDLLIIGIGTRSAQRVIDVVKENQDSLGQDQVFHQVKKKFVDSPDISGYIHIEEILKVVKKEVGTFSSFMTDKGEEAEAQKQVDVFLEKAAGLNAIGFSSQWSDWVQQKYHLFFDEDQLNQDVAFMYACPSEENKTIQFIPKDVLGYQWSNCFQLDYYWDQIQKSMRKDQEEVSALEQIKGVEDALGISIEGDILPAFGNEIGGYVSDIKFRMVPMAGEFPVPELVLFMEVKDQIKVEEILAKLTANPFIVLQEEIYEGTTIHYVELPLDIGVEPGYCFIGDYLLIALNRSLLKNAVDVHKKAKESIAVDKNFKKIILSEGNKSRGVQFLYLDQVARKIKDVVDWSRKRSSKKSNDKEEQSGDSARQEIMLQEVVYPLLEALESLKVFGAKTTVEKGMMESQLFLR